MKKIIGPPTKWEKGQTIPCPGKCGHRHVGKSGPCTETGCGCTATKKGGR